MKLKIVVFNNGQMAVVESNSKAEAIMLARQALGEYTARLQGAYELIPGIKGECAIELASGEASGELARN